MTQIILKQTPARDLSLGNTSVWGAGFNEQVFLYERRDFPVTDITVSGDNPDNIIVTSNVYDFHIVNSLNSYFRIKTPGYNFYGKLLAITVVPPADLVFGYSLLTFAAPGHSEHEGDVGGFGNSDVYRPSFSVKTTITVAGQSLVYRHRGDNTGIIRTDLQTPVRDFLTAEDNFKYNLLNVIDNNLFVKYNVHYACEYKDLDGDNITIDGGNAGDFYITWAALQLGNPYGGNMANYVTFRNQANPDKLAKFLTPFSEPIFNVGLPFDIQFIYSEKIGDKSILRGVFPPLAGTNAVVNVTRMDLLYPTQNAGLLSSVTVSFKIAGAGFIKLFTKNGDGTYNVIQSIARTFTAGLQTIDLSGLGISVPVGTYFGFSSATAVVDGIINGANQSMQFATGISGNNNPPGVLSSYVIQFNYNIDTPMPLFVKYTTLDINKNQIDGLVDESLLYNEQGEVLANPTTPIVINQTPITKLPVSFGIGVCRLMLSNIFTQYVKYVDICIYYINDSNQEIQITETKRIKIERPVLTCPDSYVYLKWLNILGGWDYFLFTYDIDNALEVSDRSFYDTQLLDTMNDDATENVLSTSVRDTLGLTLIDAKPAILKALAKINYSPKVYVLTSVQPFQWMTGSIDGKTKTLFNSNDGLGVFDGLVKLPNINTQFN